MTVQPTSRPTQPKLPPIFSGVGLLVIFVIIFLASTKPSRESYIADVTWRFKESICQQPQQTFSAQFTCATIAPMPYGLAAKFVNGYVRQEDYLFFAVYKTDLLNVNDRSIGIAGQFYPLPQSMR